MGAALPDLQREVGVALGGGWSAAVRAGIDCHREADAVFHDLPVFRTGCVALTRRLLEAGVPRGAARALGHAGWELLLDGSLLGDAALIDAYIRAMSVEVAQDAWNTALQRRVARGVPRFYADPAGVAELLWRILRDRRLLAFDRLHIEAVADCLADAQPHVAAAAPTVFAALAE